MQTIKNICFHETLVLLRFALSHFLFSVFQKISSCAENEKVFKPKTERMKKLEREFFIFIWVYVGVPK